MNRNPALLRHAISLTVAALLLLFAVVLVMDSQRDARSVVHVGTRQPWEKVN